jgi:hypothetical protein
VDGSGGVGGSIVVLATRVEEEDLGGVDFGIVVGCSSVVDDGCVGATG